MIKLENSLTRIMLTVRWLIAKIIGRRNHSSRTELSGLELLYCLNDERALQEVKEA